MFCKEGRVDRELCWAGFGFQVWLQLLTHCLSASNSDVLIVDEPEIYLHPDLQHRLFHLLKGTGKQVVLATHSVEIVNEAEHDDIVLINRIKKTARRIGDIDGLQEALFSIGSAQNVHLARLKSEVLSQHISNRMRYFSARSAKDPSTLASEAIANLDNDWANAKTKLMAIPGKRVLTSLNHQLQQKFNISITPTQILRNIDTGDIAADLRNILGSLNQFAKQ
jgi:ABC-type multidrug transport system ATPase subunit